MVYPIVRPLLFKLDPETVHRWTLALLRAVGGFAPARALVSALYAAPPKPVVAFGLMFRNPVGLAAGYDKDGLGWCGLAALGFGHIEVGTITVRPQPGNPKPRVFRLPEDDGLINRLGFPGLGMEIVAAEMSRRCPSGVMLGANLGKNKDTPNEEAAQDYVTLMERFAPLADYLVVNVSSPNTVGLRRLQARDALETLLAHLARHRAEYLPDSHIPVLVKLAPDLDEAELDDALDVILRTGMDGVIATNTTLARENLRSPRAGETGGLSGAPLTEMSYAMLQSIVKRLDGALPVVSVGGIMSAEDAKMRLDAGAALVQVYTGLIYRGPGFVRDIVRAC